MLRSNMIVILYAILNAISVTSAFVSGVGLIYLMLDGTVGRLRLLHSAFEWYGLQVKDFAFLAVAVTVIVAFTHLIRPF